MPVESRTIPESEAQMPQEWLDQKREQAYDAISADAEKALNRGDKAGEFLQKVIEFGLTNPVYAQRFKELLMPEDFQNVELYIIHSKSASEIAGQRIERIVFTIPNPATYRKFEKAFFGQGGDSHGVTLPGSLFNQLPNWRDGSLILTQDSDTTIVHEIRHTVDPDTGKRSGYNKIIEETFAYYQECIVDGHENWSDLEGSIGNDFYYNKYSKESSQEISKDQWQNTVRQVIEKLKALHKEHGDLKLQRMLVQTKTLDQLFAQQ